MNIESDGVQIALFPEQGAQRVGTGGRLFDEVAEFAAVESQVDEILGFSVRQLCAEGPHTRLGETQFKSAVSAP